MPSLPKFAYGTIQLSNDTPRLDDFIAALTQKEIEAITLRNIEMNKGIAIPNDGIKLQVIALARDLADTEQFRVKCYCPDFKFPWAMIEVKVDADNRILEGVVIFMKDAYVHLDLPALF